MYDLKGKVAVVTGTAGRRGIGRAIAVRLASDGADVVIVDKYPILPWGDNAPGWRGTDSVLEEIQSRGVRGLSQIVDVTRSDQVDNMVQQVVSRLGRIDIMVNNAGIYGPRNSLARDMSDEEWRDTLEVNLFGAFYCCRAAARKMIEQGQGGSIVNISSVLGKFGRLGPFGGGHTAYCASKFGMIGLTQCLALELSPYKIRVNSVCPGAVRTDSMTDLIRTQAKLQGVNEQVTETQYYEGLMRDTPLKRPGTVEECAAIVAFLCSKESDYVQGQSININGGLLMAH